MQRDQDRQLNIRRQEVAALTLDSLIELKSGPSRNHILRVESVFYITGPEGVQRIKFSPGTGEPPQGMDRLVSVVGSVVTGAVAALSGALDLELTNGLLIHVDADDDYEAW